MSETKTIDFSLLPVEVKPTRKYRKGSKYHPILNQYLETTLKAKDNALMKVNVSDKEANYLRTQLNKIITKDKLPIKVSVVNNEVYLERVVVKELKA